MASTLVQKFRNDIAPRLMAKFANGGVYVDVRTVTPKTDPLLPPTVTSVSAKVNAYAKGVTAQMVASDPNLQITDLRVLLAAVDLSPKVNDMLEVNGSDRRVIRVDAIPADGPPAIYWAFVR